jgi:hypothetical protein
MDSVIDQLWDSCWTLFKQAGYVLVWEVIDDQVSLKVNGDVEDGVESVVYVCVEQQVLSGIKHQLIEECCNGAAST